MLKTKVWGIYNDIKAEFLQFFPGLSKGVYSFF